MYNKLLKRGEWDLETLKRLLCSDPGLLSEEELLATVFSLTEPEGTNVIELAKKLMESFRSLSDILKASPNLLSAFGLSKESIVLLKACKGMIYHFDDKLYPHNKVFTKEHAYKYFKNKFIGEKTETLYLMLIDKSEEILGIEKIAQGNLDKLMIDPKIIIDIAVKYNASKVVLAHNHFTGSAPSTNDVILTSKLVWFFGYLKIELCDHFIFYKNECHSMVDAKEMTTLSYNLMFSDDL